MKLIALIALLLTACASGSSGVVRSSSSMAADATALAYEQRAEQVRVVGEVQAQRQREADATDEAVNATSTQQAANATATWVARPTTTPTAIPSHTPTVAPSRTPTVAPTATAEPSATVEPSRAAVALVVVGVTVTPQPIATNAPVVTPLAGAIGSIVVSLIMLLIVLRVLKLMQTNGD